MAARRKKPKLGELSPQPDPKAPLSGAVLLEAAKPVLKQLSDDLLQRADSLPAITEALKARHAQEQKAERTADAYSEWRRQFTVQVSAAWFLSCVFVRTLEDRGLLGRTRLAGQGAMDSQRAFFALAPSLNERDYLYFVFRELTHLRAAEELFDARHNPVWLLAPSADAAKALVGFFRTPTTDAPAFRFGGEDTRFLGDLYQDLSEDVRKRYALLQTPRFVEQFILDRTLERALERFGLEDTNLIDPTCGSGHFLLGAFDRLLERRLQDQPGLDVRQAALKALDAVAGADINPYAVAIARFRLTLAYLEKAGFTRLKDAPRLPLHVAVADSLLHNPHLKQTSLGDLEGADATAWKGTEFALEDPAAAREVLHMQYAAVVGNPPYIAVRDAVLRERYRQMYSRSTSGKYLLAAPFCERFFQLARERGRVGMVTTNAITWRSFARTLIEKYLPRVNLDLVIDTSGVVFSRTGFGRPTVMLFGSAEAPQSPDVDVVMGRDGEPSTPREPERGLVWTSIVESWRDFGFENEFITVGRMERSVLAKHPWSLSGGGAAELRSRLEERGAQCLADVATIGVFGMTNADECMVMPSRAWARTGVESEYVRALGVGEEIRDWGWLPRQSALYPYKWPAQLVQPNDSPGLFRYLWPYRTSMGNRATFGGGTYFRDGLPWWKWHQVTKDRVGGRTIVFAYVATHNHFVLDRGERVFKQTAPIVKLTGDASEDQHLALLAYLNSSTVCFWLKQVARPSTVAAGEKVLQPDPAKIAYELPSKQLRPMPIPNLDECSPLLAQAARELETISAKRQGLASRLPAPSIALAELQEEDAALLARMVALQEAIDALVYAAFGLARTSDLPSLTEAARAAICGSVAIEPDERAFLRKRTPTNALSAAIDQATRGSSDLRLLEAPLYKRRWLGVQGRFRAEGRELSATLLESLQERVWDWVERELSAGSCVWRLREMARCAAKSEAAAAGARMAGTVLDSDAAASARTVDADAVPYVAALRLTALGVDKHRAWERTWELQRREDAGDDVGEVPVPPKYAQKDYRDPVYWRLRGKSDAPKERFISYPGCESDQDGEPVYGWAGWNHLQRAVALAELYQKRKMEEGWSKERLQPMLVGLLELLPWLKQWHNEPSEELGGDRPGEQFAQFIDAECAEHGFTHNDLRNWRPPKKKRGSARVGGKAKRKRRTEVEEPA